MWLKCYGANFFVLIDTNKIRLDLNAQSFFQQLDLRTGLINEWSYQLDYSLDTTSIQVEFLQTT